MEISRMLAGLNKITSFFASTTSNTFKHLLTITASFNDRTSLTATLQPSPPQETHETATPTTATFDVEAPAPGAGPETPDGDEEESKRVSKAVLPVCLFAASASLVMLVNLPKAADVGRHALLYSVDLALICLGMFTSLALSMYAVAARSDEPRVVRMKKRVMVMAMAFVLVSVMLRMSMMLPMASLEFAWLFFFIGAGVVSLYLSLT